MIENQNAYPKMGKVEKIDLNIDQLKKQIAESEEGLILTQKSLMESVIKLGERLIVAESLIKEFVDRCEKGEIRSKKTYAKFKAFLENK